MVANNVVEAHCYTVDQVVIDSVTLKISSPYGCQVVEKLAIIYS